ncbi:MAG: undecaprenyl-diphosphate phosphatase [Ruminococcaceae bacterium]|nr:undecaprenyl-diphosphate phosphatase [Oscillospiraceae bacterium]
MKVIFELLKAFLYGIVEGITEWLPVSSTGHLILLEELLPMQVSEAFWEMFLVVVQLGAILAVVVLFWNQIFPFSFKKGESLLRRDIWALWLKIVVACVPACVYAFLLDDIVEPYLYNYITVAVMLIVVGIAFLAAERYLVRRTPAVSDTGSITFRIAFWIGMFQLIAAILPGTSRSGATIIGGLLLGLSRTAAAEFTFFLAIPVMAGGSLLKLLKFGFDFTALEAGILAVGTAVSFAVSIIVIRFLLDYVRRRNFNVFAYYRIALGVAVLGYFLLFR